MCGGFTCSKNALIALNVLYVVRYFIVIFCIYVVFSYWLSLLTLYFYCYNIWLLSTYVNRFFAHRVYKLVTFPGGGQHLDISGGVWAGVVTGHEPAHRGRYTSMWGIPYFDFFVGTAWSCEASSSYAILCILFKSECVHNFQLVLYYILVHSLTTTLLSFHQIVNYCDNYPEIIMIDDIGMTQFNNTMYMTKVRHVE